MFGGYARLLIVKHRVGRRRSVLARRSAWEKEDYRLVSPRFKGRQNVEQGMQNAEGREKGEVGVKVESAKDEVQKGCAAFRFATAAFDVRCWTLDVCSMFDVRRRSRRGASRGGLKALASG